MRDPDAIEQVADRGPCARGAPASPDRRARCSSLSCRPPKSPDDITTTVSPGEARSARCSTVCLDVGDDARRDVLAPQIGGQPLDVEAIALGRLLRARRAAPITTSSATDSASANSFWKTLRAAGGRARLEDGDQLARAVAPRSASERLADRRRVMREVVDHGHALRDAAHLLPPPHADEAPHAAARSPAARAPGCAATAIDAEQRSRGCRCRGGRSRRRRTARPAAPAPAWCARRARARRPRTSSRRPSPGRPVGDRPGSGRRAPPPSRRASRRRRPAGRPRGSAPRTCGTRPCTASSSRKMSTWSNSTEVRIAIRGR